MSDSLRPHELYSPWNSPGQNIGVGIAYPFSMGSSWPRNWTRVSCIEPPLLSEDSLPAELPGRPPLSLPKLPLHFWEFWAAAQYNFCRTLVPDLVLSDSPALVLLPSPTSHPLRSSRFASALWNPLKFHLQGPASSIDWNPSSGEVWFSKPYIRCCKVTDIYIYMYIHIYILKHNSHLCENGQG